MFSEQIKQAISEQKKLQIIGNSSKVVPKQGFDRLDLTQHQGIIQYQPEELLLTVKAGTTLGEINQALEKNQQYLPFEPPEYGNSTIGGTYACGLSGSSQPFVGRLRDFVLGIKIINGLGEHLTFGGQMMKNVAGYDVSRLLVGSAGGFALIDEISFKILPKMLQQTYAIEMPEDEAIILMNQWAGSELPLSACAYYQGKFYYRLSGPHDKQTNPEVDGQIWQTLNPFKISDNEQKKLWKLSVDSTLPPIKGTIAIDHCGARRWVVADKMPEDNFIQTKAIKELTLGLKAIFDPKKVFVAHYAD